MGHTVASFEEGTPAWRVFFPVLVAGWETLRPVLVRWGLEVPEVLDRRTTMKVVRLFRGQTIATRIETAKAAANLKSITEAESVETLATSWMVLATWAARYERRRRDGLPTALAWLQTLDALQEFRKLTDEHAPNLN